MHKDVKLKGRSSRLLECPKSLWSLSEGFGKLDKLKKLDLEHCPARHGLPAQLKNKLVAQGCAIET